MDARIETGKVKEELTDLRVHKCGTEGVRGGWFPGHCCSCHFHCNSTPGQHGCQSHIHYTARHIHTTATPSMYSPHAALHAPRTLFHATPPSLQVPVQSSGQEHRDGLAPHRGHPLRTKASKQRPAVTGAEKQGTAEGVLCEQLVDFVTGTQVETLRDGSGHGSCDVPALTEVPDFVLLYATLVKDGALPHGYLQESIAFETQVRRAAARGDQRERSGGYFAAPTTTGPGSGTTS